MNELFTVEEMVIGLVMNYKVKVSVDSVKDSSIMTQLTEAINTGIIKPRTNKNGVVKIIEGVYTFVENTVDEVAHNVLTYYKKIYNNESARNKFLKKRVGENYVFESNFCLSVDALSKIVSKAMKLNKSDVENTLMNSNSNLLPKIKYNLKRKGSYSSGSFGHYYYLGDVK